MYIGNRLREVLYGQGHMSTVHEAIGVLLQQLFHLLPFAMKLAERARARVSRVSSPNLPSSISPQRGLQTSNFPSRSCSTQRRAVRYVVRFSKFQCYEMFIIPWVGVSVSHFHNAEVSFSKKQITFEGTPYYSAVRYGV